MITMTSEREAFDAWVKSLPDTHWAKHDISACRLGWNAALAQNAQGEEKPIGIVHDFGALDWLGGNYPKAGTKLYLHAERARVPDADPVNVSLATMKESNGRVTHMAVIRRGDRYMEDGHTSIKGRAEYYVAKWEWLLLGADEPDILAFDCDPPAAPSQPEDFE